MSSRVESSMGTHRASQSAELSPAVRPPAARFARDGPTGHPPSRRPGSAGTSIVAGRAGPLGQAIPSTVIPTQPQPMEGTAVVVVSKGRASIGARTEGNAGGHAAAVMAIVEAPSAQHALAGLTTAHRERHERTVAAP